MKNEETKDAIIALGIAEGELESLKLRVEELKSLNDPEQSIKANAALRRRSAEVAAMRRELDARLYMENLYP